MAKQSFAEHCALLLSKKYKDSLSQKDISEVVGEIQDFNIGDGSKQDITRDIEQHIARRSEDLEIKRLQEIDRILKASDLIKNIELEDAFKLNGYLDDPAEAIASIYLGAERLTKGASRTIETDGHILEAGVMNPLINELEEKGLLDVLKSRELNKEIFIEMMELKKGGRPGISKSKTAQEIAVVLNKAQKNLLNQMQLAGSSVRNLDGYIMRQAHDIELIRDAGYDNWKKDILPLLDTRKSFGAKDFKNSEKIDEFLTEIYQKVVRGEFHFDPNDGGARRVLHFKDGENFYNYNEKYGNKEILDSVVNSIRSTGRKASIMSTLGVDSRKTWDQLISSTKEVLRANMEDAAKKADSKLIDQTSKAWDKFQSKENFLENTYKEMVGITTMPGRSFAARTAHGVRQIISMSKLGKAPFAGITDLPNSVSVLRSATGKGYLESYKDLMGNFFENIPNAKKQEMATRLKMVLDDSLGEIHSKFSGEQGGPGAITRMSQAFFKYSGFNKQATISRAAVAKQFAIELGGVSHLTFEQLGKENLRMKANIERYGIKNYEWELVRQNLDDFEGIKAITPDKIETLTDAQLAPLLKDHNAGVRKKLTSEQYRQDIEMKFAAYLADHAELGSPMPKARERVTLLQGTDSDSATGILLRMMAQFRTYPFVIGRVVKRIAQSNPNVPIKKFRDGIDPRKGAFWDLAALMGSTTAFGYMSMVMKDFVSGKTPKDPTDPKVMLDAMIAGGTGGIYTDLILGDYDRMNRSVVGSLAGPAGGILDDIGELFARARKGDLTAGKALTKIINNTPFQNIWWGRWAADYLFLNELNEELNPGWAARRRRSIRKNPGLDGKAQRFFMGPDKKAFDL